MCRAVPGWTREAPGRPYPAFPTDDRSLGLGRGEKEKRSTDVFHSLSSGENTPIGSPGVYSPTYWFGWEVSRLEGVPERPHPSTTRVLDTVSGVPTARPRPNPLSPRLSIPPRGGSHRAFVKTSRRSLGVWCLKVKVDFSRE